MKKLRCIPLAVVLVVSVLVPHQSMAISPTSIATVDQKASCTSTLFAPLTLFELKDMKRKEVEMALDRKLKLRERQVLKVLRKHVTRVDKLGLTLTDDACREMERKASNAIVFGVIGLFLAGIILGILAISAGSRAQRLADSNPDCPNAADSKRRGRTGVILGVIDVVGAIIVLALIL
ncbi:MAG: hypothetical protein R3301_03720 [Saprospiraceae bacterium]|nr:hypothetical protein [Saprospiraceae bacterium]